MFSSPSPIVSSSYHTRPETDWLWFFKKVKDCPGKTHNDKACPLARGWLLAPGWGCAYKEFPGPLTAAIKAAISVPYHNSITVVLMYSDCGIGDRGIVVVVETLGKQQ